MKKLISIIAVLFTMFSLSAATVEYYKPNEDKPTGSKHISIKNSDDFEIYADFGWKFVWSEAKITLTKYAYYLEYMNEKTNMKEVLRFEGYEVEDMKYFGDLTESYTNYAIENKLWKRPEGK